MGNFELQFRSMDRLVLLKDNPIVFAIKVVGNYVILALIGITIYFAIWINFSSVG